MSTTTANHIRIGRPQVSTLLPDDHYTVTTREVTYAYSSRWTQFLTVLATIFAGVSRAVSVLLMGALAVGIIFFGVSMASAAEETFPSIQHIRVQEVPQSGNTLDG